MSKIPATEKGLLAELGQLSDQIRMLRAEGRPNGDRIKPLESQMSLKWQQLRMMRAGPVNEDSPESRPRGSFRL